MCTPTWRDTTSTSSPQAGYLEVSSTKKPGAGVGRPSKHYRASAGATDADNFPVRTDDLVLSLLGRALDRLPTTEAEAIAEEVGAEYGRACCRF